MSEKVQVNLYTIQNPLVGIAVENRHLTPESRGPENDVRHITIRYEGKFPYLPGQSVGIISPGVDPGTGKPHKLRLYSIASARVGDYGDGQTVSLCVVRHFWENLKTGKSHIPGVASNYLCDLKVQDPVKMTGPVGRHFLLPDDFKPRDLIFVATGTGIAPYRGMLKEIFDADFKGRVWLYFGVKFRDTVLYDNEFEPYRKYKNFFYIKAISREEKNPIPDFVPTRENKMYVQVKMFQDRKVLGEALAKSTSLVYLCGLKGMEQGIFPTIDKIGVDLGRSSFVAELKAQHRLRVEVY